MSGTVAYRFTCATCGSESTRYAPAGWVFTVSHECAELCFWGFWDIR